MDDVGGGTRPGDGGNGSDRANLEGALKSVTAALVGLLLLL